MMRNNKFLTFYNTKMSLNGIEVENYSMSPNKPKLFLEYLKIKKFDSNLEIISDFEPYKNIDFEIAHTSKYVSDFFEGKKPLAESNGLKWSEQFSESVRYTNSSFYHTIKTSILKPENVCFSPTSGFHHAKPNNGSAFCTFSGQVIASAKIYKELGLKGAYLDLDGHFGNSIEDSRKFIKELNVFIPIDCNINPKFIHTQYLKDLEHHLQNLKEKILNNEIHYLVHCKGADSHMNDDLGGQLTTKEWLKASEMAYTFVKEISNLIGNPFPLSISLFGGYRKKAYNKVLDLHLKDLDICKKILFG